MISCSDQYVLDMKACKDAYDAEFARCLTLPTAEEQQACLQAAQARRNQCEAAAYLRYVGCISQTGGSGNSASQGGCGCGGGE